MAKNGLRFLQFAFFGKMPTLVARITKQFAKIVILLCENSEIANSYNFAKLTLLVYAIMPETFDRSAKFLPN